MQDARLKLAIQEATKYAYTKQEERITQGNKISKSFRQKNGIQNPPEKDPIFGMESEEKTSALLLKTLQENFQNWQAPTEEFIPKGLIGDQETYNEVQKYGLLVQEEEDAFQAILPLIGATNIGVEYLNEQDFLTPGIKGIITGWFNIKVAKFPSNFWSYAGLNPNRKPEGPKVVHQLTDLPREKDDHNPFVKAKMISELGTKIARRPSKWEKTFREYKDRIANDTTKTIRSNSHLHNMAIRYTIKEFLKELHLTWRALEGYAPPEAYKPRNP